MILNTITLHNFMSYGDAFLDLSSCNIACLTGYNGAGKSAILDAVTWALWESARSNSDDLIRIGEHEMWVELTFQLEANTYRVRRMRQRGSSNGTRAAARSTLDFQVLDGACDINNGNNGGAHWRSLNAANVRDTRARICDLLRMDYDTFVNSVYLRQGKADEFTTRAPAERKQVLADILGLSYFDRLQELAREHARNAKMRMELLKAGLDQKDSLDEDMEQLEVQCSELSALLEQSKRRRQELHDSCEEIGQKIAHLSSLQAQITPTHERLHEITADMASLEERLHLTVRKLDLIKSLQDEVGNASELRARFDALRNELEHLDRVNLSRQSLESRRAELKSVVAALRGRLEVELEHSFAHCESLKQRAQKLEEQLSAKAKLTSEYQKYKDLIAREAELAKCQEVFSQLTERAGKLHTAIVEARFYAEAQLEQKRQSLAEFDNLIAGKQALDSELAEITSRRQQLDKTESEFEYVEEQGLQAKQDIDALTFEISKLNEQAEEYAQKINEIKDCESSICPLCAAPIVDRAAVVVRYEIQIAGLKKKLDDVQLNIQKLEEKRHGLRVRYVELKRLLEQRKALDVAIGDFNARAAAVARAQNSRERLAEEIAELEKRLSQQSFAQIERESLVAVKAELSKLDFDPVVYASLQSQIRSLRHVEIRFQQLSRDESELTRTTKELEEALKKVEDLRLALSSQNFASDESQEIEELSKKLDEMPYDRTRHQAVKEELSRLLPLADKLKQLETGLCEQPALAAEEKMLRERLMSRQQQHEELSRSMAVWQNQSLALPELEATRHTHQLMIVEIDESIDRLTDKLANARARRDSLMQAMAEKETKQTELNAALTECNQYQMLSEAFGKKGIQAVIIENAVPEIEAEANQLLSRLSDNQMHVALVTQQKTKQGSITETLDILIADQLGTRPYELYSGGEAFKVNFAIRLALSRLLARRSGAKLQSLIIDEGFGSQDEISRARLVKAINAIRRDFARILIVTHIAEMKDIFPTQIQVSKQNGLSSLNLVHA